MKTPPVVLAAAALTAVVAVSAFSISFASLVFVGRTAGVSDDLAVAFPITIDGMLAVGVLAAVVLRHAPLRSRLFVWLLIGAAVAVSVVGNVSHARAAGGNWLAAAAGAVPPLALATTLELLVMLIRHNRQPAPKAKRRTKAEQVAAPEQPVAEWGLDALSARPVPAGSWVTATATTAPAPSNGHAKRPPARGKPGVRAQHLARTRELLDADPRVTGKQVGEVIKRDPSYGRSLLREVRAEREAVGAGSGRT